MIQASTYLGLAANLNTLSVVASGPFTVDFTGGVYAMGFAGTNFQPSPNVYLSKAPNGGYQAIALIRLNSSLSAAVYQTYFDNGASVLRPDSSGNLFIASGTSNNTAGFSEMNASGTGVTHTTQIGSGITDLQIDSAGNIWAAGYSISGGFPSANSLQIDPAPASYSAAWYQMYPFFAEFTPGGTNSLQATLFYGPNFEVQPAFGTLLIRLLRPGGRLCLTGLPGGTQTTGGIVSAQGNYATSLACVDDSGTRLGLRTGLPSTGDNYTAAQTTPDGAVLFGGQAYGGLSTTPGVVQPVYAGSATYNSYGINGGDAFLLRVSLLNPLPAISALWPDSLYVNMPNNPNTGGGWNFSLYGSGFAFGTQLTWNSQNVSSVVQSSTQMSITALPVSAVQSGTNQLVASLPSPGGGVSNAFTVTAYNPPPGSLVITPAQVTAGAGETKVVVTGTGLLASSVLTWNGSPRNVTFVPVSGFTSARLELLLEPSDLAQPSAANITVTNPAPGGGTSPVARFVVQASSGTVVPSLSGPVLYRFDETNPIPATFALTGSGFTTSTVAYWDGAPIPSSIMSATQLNVTPPSADLAVIGSHDVYVINGALASATIRMKLAHTAIGVLKASDPARRLVYLLAGGNTQPPVYDLAVQDAITGKQIAIFKAIMSSVNAAALSDDGSYFYLGGGTSGGEIKRFNTSSNAVDLDWQLPTSYLATSISISALATVTSSPETIIVVSSSQGAPWAFTVYDRGQARPAAGTANLSCCGIPLFATANRVFIVGQAPFPCLQWFDFDSGGVESFSGTCGINPPELVHRDGFAWLTDGSRTRFVGAPSGAGNAGYPGLTWLIDPQNNVAWALAAPSSLQLLRFDMATTQMTTLVLPGIQANTGGASLLLNNDVSLRILVTPGQISAP